MIDFRRTFMSSVTIVIPSIKEAVVQRCSVKKMFLEFNKIHRKTLVPDPFF